MSLSTIVHIVAWAAWKRSPSLAGPDTTVVTSFILGLLSSSLVFLCRFGVSRYGGSETGR